MAMGSLAGIVERLRANGMPGELPVGIVREGTKPTQETLVGTLETIVGEVERTGFAAPAIVVIGNVVREREHIRWFDNGPLFGKRVLVTRPAAGAADFAAALWEAGAEPVLAPTIAIDPPDDPVPAAAALAALGEYAWVVFASRNGVDACFRLSARARRRRPPLRHREGCGRRTKDGRPARALRHTRRIRAARLRRRVARRGLSRAHEFRRTRAALRRARDARRP